MLRNLPKTCLIVPCFNEEKRLCPSLFLEFVTAHSEFSLCLVNDGSTDDTIGALRRLSESLPGRIDVLDLAGNQGKGNAVRSGMMHALSGADFEYLAYWDADLATPLAEAPLFREILARRPECEMVCGCRLGRLGARIRRRWHRHYLGRIFATLASLALGVPVYDSQCGAKLLTRSLAAQVFGDPFVARWCFDVEILARIIQKRGREALGTLVVESPLESWSEQGGSKLGFWHSLAALIDLWRIRRKYL